MFSSQLCWLHFCFSNSNVRQSALVRVPLTACLSADFCTTTQKLGRCRSHSAPTHLSCSSVATILDSLPRIDPPMNYQVTPGFRFPSIIKPKDHQQHQQGQDKYKPLTTGSQLVLIFFTSATSQFHSSHDGPGAEICLSCGYDWFRKFSTQLPPPPAADHPLSLTSPHCPPWQRAAAFVNPVSDWSSRFLSCILIGQDGSLGAGTPGGVTGSKAFLASRLLILTALQICHPPGFYSCHLIKSENSIFFWNWNTIVSFLASSLFYTRVHPIPHYILFVFLLFTIYIHFQTVDKNYINTSY